MFGIGRNALLVRNVTKSFVRNHNGGTPGENIPFQISDINRLTLLFAAFFGSGLAAPFLIVRHQILKQSQS